MKRLFFSILAASLLLAAPQVATASFINGEIAIGGTLTTDSNDLLNATSITGIPTSDVTAVAGDFANAIGGDADGIDVKTAVSWNTPISLSNGPQAISNLWSLTDPDGTSSSFDLRTLVVQSQTADQLILRGTGTLKLDTYQDTRWGQFKFTANSGGLTLTFSSNTFAVPEAGTVASWSLMGLTGLGMVWFRRRK